MTTPPRFGPSYLAISAILLLLNQQWRTSINRFAEAMTLFAGLWGAQLGATAIWVLPVTFPMVMAVGGFLGLVGVPLPGVEAGIALSAIALGGAVARESRPQLALAALLVAAFAVFHGHAHGTELPEGQSGMTYSIGFVIATGCLHGPGIGLGLVHRWAWGRTAIRTAGLAIAAAGAWFLWRTL